MIQKDELIHWWANIEPLLGRYARSYGLDPESAKDVVQDVAVLVLREHSKAALSPKKLYPQFADEAEFRRWVKARLHWMMLDRIRSKKPLVGELLDFVPQTSVPPDQEEALIAKEEQALRAKSILSLIKQLPPKQGMVMDGLIKGRSYEDIARELEVKEGTVRSLKRFAMLKLVTLLSEQRE